MMIDLRSTPLIPAKAGIQLEKYVSGKPTFSIAKAHNWIPAFAGMSGL